MREARDASSSDIPWEWDPATLEQGAKKTFLENFNVGEVRVFPNHLIPRTDCPYSYQKGLLPLTVQTDYGDCCPYIVQYTRYTRLTFISSQSGGLRAARERVSIFSHGASRVSQIQPPLFYL